MTKLDPKVAIGIPVYNGQKYIARAIECALDQTYSDFRLFISDNASNDETEDICRDYANRDKRVIYMRQPKNLGAVPNFNHVFEVSDSKYYKWAAVDDLYDKSYLQKAVAILDNNPDVVWCHSRTSHIDFAGHLLDVPDGVDVAYPERESETTCTRFKSVLLGQGGCHDIYGLIRSAAIRQTPGHIACYGSEKILIAELCLLGRYMEIPETLFFCGVVEEGSGNLRTAEEQQAFVDARRPKSTRNARLTTLNGYMSAIRRSAPNSMEAMRCRMVVLQWLFQVSKWRSVLEKSLKGQGLGGGNIERIKQIQEK